MIVAYIDGGARGNPGPAGFGVRIEQPDGTLVEEFHESIGTATNNVAVPFRFGHQIDDIDTLKIGFNMKFDSNRYVPGPLK